MNQENYFGEEAFTMTPKQLLDNLTADAASQEERVYNEPLSSDELAAGKDNLVQLSVQYERLADEKKEAMAGFKDKMDPIALEKKRVLNEVKNGFRERKGNVFLIPDYDNKKMVAVAPDGRILSTSPMTPAQRQKDMFISGKDRATGTDL